MDGLVVEAVRCESPRIDRSTMTRDLATPNLPSSDLDRTMRFYRRLGFREAFRDEGWLILVRGSIQIEFFPHADLDPRSTIASCCVRVADLEGLHRTWSAAGIPATEVGMPRITAPRTHSGFREFAVVDPDGNLLRCLSPAGEPSHAEQRPQQGKEPMAASFVWNELLTGDVEGAKTFLSETFGWSFEDFPLPDGPYWVAKAGDDIVAGVCHYDAGSLPTRQPVWLSFVQVDDVDERVEVARRAGAQVVQEPHDVPNVGRVALLKDPAGAPLGLLSARDSSR